MSNLSRRLLRMPQRRTRAATLLRDLALKPLDDLVVRQFRFTHTNDGTNQRGSVFC
jgi:hypothetical protein